MKNKENKIRKHPFLDKHTVLGAIVLMLWGFFFAEVLFATIVGIIFELVGIPIHFSAVLGAFVLLYIHYRWFRPNYQGSIKGGNLALGFKLAAFMCIYYAFLLIQTFVWSSFSSLTTSAVPSDFQCLITHNVLLNLCNVCILVC